MMVFFVISYTLKIITIILVNFCLRKLSDPIISKQISDLDLNYESSQKQITFIFYWLNSGIFRAL